MAERVRATFYRGGTSKAVIFRAQDLPEAVPPTDCSRWDPIFFGVMGSPDPYGRQLDGMGGGQSSLSKIAVVSPSSREGVDVDFTFAQVGIDKASISYRGNCGNISSAIGPFALEEGMVELADGQAIVRMFNTNTSKMMTARFEVAHGLLEPSGDLAIDGVPGTASPIEVSFLDPSGAVTGHMFPTGNLFDDLTTSDGETFEVTVVDVANPLVIVRMQSVNSQTEDLDFIDFESSQMVALAERIRIAAAVQMGIVPDAETARTKITNLPLVAMVRPPCDFQSRSGVAVARNATNIVTQMYSAGLPHKATPVTGALALAAAGQVPGTVAHQMARFTPEATEVVKVGHPSGVLQVSAVCQRTGDGWVTLRSGVFRTARRLFEGNVVLP